MNYLAQLPVTNPRISPELSNSGSLLGNLVSKLLVYSIAAAGIYFFIRTVASGFIYLTSFGDPAKIQAAHKSLINALTGLVIIISTFFISQIIEVVFGIKILSI